MKIRKDSSQEKPGFFAMANAPGGSDRLFEFLIKRTDGSAWICDASEVELSPQPYLVLRKFEALPNFRTDRP